ncbi:MAG: protein-L-isoaspartate(D-aspartate) O-methyltransferase [Acidobacteriota bacterium]|nr:protein-L-isoaspartate(D-aspartate) O-methyltransferase [Acidobacteriota bacterium]
MNSVQPQFLNDGFAIPRKRMVEYLREHHRIKDERVLAAMLAVPRHLFVPEALHPKAYGDHALPIAAGQTISQPFIVARMTELLELTPKSRVLEIGFGSGYQTAVLSLLAREVFAVERQPELANETEERLRRLGVRNVYLRCADGTRGWEAGAPFHAILVAAGGPEIPDPLLYQLAIGGRLVIPVGNSRESQILTRIIRSDEDKFVREEHGSCAFVPLIGKHGWEK